MNFKVDLTRFALLSSVVAIGVLAASAQSYYDDDIYYDASKVKKETPAKQTVKQTQAVRPVQQQTTATQLYYDGAQYVPWSNVGEYQSADTYQATGSSTRDVDEYNRRYTTPSNAQPDSLSLQQYLEMSNTQKLARFQDSDVAAIAVAEGDYDYADVNTYYKQPTTTINLNVIGGYPYYGYYGYNSPWYWSSWAFDPWWGGYYGYYSPYWNWGWGPSWSWNWAWGGPHWGPSWGWGGPHWGGHWGGHWAYRPQSSYGSYRPHTTQRPTGSTASHRYTTGGSNYRNGVGSNVGVGTRQPSATGATARPGYRQPLGTPSSVGTQSATRGRNSSAQSNSYSAPATNHYNSSPSNSTYRNSSSGSSRGSSTGSFGGSGSRGGFSGSGSNGGGGGGRRGR